MRLMNWIANLYSQYLMNAVMFFHDLRDRKDVAWNKPPTLSKGLYIAYIGNHIFLFMLIVQLASGNTILALVNVFNFTLNMITISKSLNNRHLTQMYWVPFAGHRVKAKIVEYTDSSRNGTTLALSEKLQWCQENLEYRDWTIHDKGFWLNPEHIKNKVGKLSFADLPRFLHDRDEATVDFVFRKKRDASLFKLTWGNA